MTWPGHIAFGYLATQAILHVTPHTFTSSQNTILTITGLVASVLPDMDFVPFFLKHRSLKLQQYESHRTYVTHAPIISIGLGLLVILIGSSAQSIFTIHIGSVFIAAILSHFIGDTIEYGVMWFWPFSHAQYCLHLLPPEHIQSKSVPGYYAEFFMKEYVRHLTFYIELVIVVIAIFVLA